MHTFGQVFQWLTDPSHWSGSDGIPVRVLQHVEISAVSVAGAAILAIPIGLLVGHRRRGAFLAVSIANVGRSIPSFAILSIAFLIFLNLAPSFAFGFGPTVTALFLLAVPPILTNTYVGVQAVDPDMVEAARGMGMTEPQVLRRLEVPLAGPLIMAGLRTSAVTVVATATLAALIGGGGLGRYIVDGFHTADTVKVVSGAVLVAVLAVVTELLFGAIERASTPRTVSRSAARRS
jgi:osmoprotectant transport system permease protein